MNRWSIIILVSAAVLSVGCKSRAVKLLQQPASSGPVVVKVEEVKPGGAASGTVYVGSISASRTVTLTAAAPGTIDKLSVRSGQKVTKGQVLCHISSESVESACKATSSRLSQAEDALRRVQKVYESGAVAEIEYIDIKTKVEEARAAHAAACDARDRCSMKAPYSGVIEKVWSYEGEEVILSKPILSIVDLESVKAHFSLPESEYHLYREGIGAEVEIPALEKTFPGTLESKGLTASVLSRSYDCEVSLPRSATGLMPGMVCKIRLSGKVDDERVVIPASAVMTDKGGRFVWTATGGVVGKKYVVPDGFSGNGIIVSEGLEEGDLVIVSGASKVSTGMKVETQR